MRNFSQFCRKCMAAYILVLVLAYPTLAGEMQYPGITNPPPSTTSDIQASGVTTSAETADGDTQFPGTTVDSITGLTLTLWQTTLALF